MDRWSKVNKFLTWVGLIGSVVVLLGQFALEIRRHYMPRGLPADTIKKLEADAKRDLPQKIDDMTTLVDVKYEPTRISWWYVLYLGDNKMPIGPHEMEQRLQQQLCDNPENSSFIKQGFSYAYHYASKAGVSIADFTITTCP